MASSKEVVQNGNEKKGNEEDISCSNCNDTKSSRWTKNAEGNLICFACHLYPNKHKGMARPADKAERDRIKSAKIHENNERRRQEKGQSGKHPCKNCKREDSKKWLKNETGGYDCVCRNCYLYFKDNGEHRPRELEILRIANLKKTAERVFKAAKKGKKIPESDKDSEEEPASREPKRKKMRVAESSSNDRKELDSSVGDKVSGSAAHSDDVGVVSEEAEVEENEESVKEAENALMVEDNEVFESDHGFEANQILDEVVQQGNQILDQVVDEVEPLAEQEENAMETQDAMTVEDEVLEMNPGFEADQILDEVVDDPEADQVEADNVEMVNQPVVLQGAAQLVADEDDDVICIGTVAAPRLIPAIEKDGQLLVVRPNRLTSQAKTFFGRLPRHISRISLSFL